MEEDEFTHFQQPSVVSLAPLSLSKTRERRLSLRAQRGKPTFSLYRDDGAALAWINLEGRLVGCPANDLSSDIVGLVKSSEEAVSWELFTPIQRVLIVAVVAAASAKCNNNNHQLRRIAHLERSIQDRDEVLHNMQQKLDELCGRMGFMQDQPENFAEPPMIDIECCSCRRRSSSISENGSKSSFPRNPDPMIYFLKQFQAEGLEKEESLKMPLLNVSEPEERRMSDLSDWCSSVTSGCENQPNIFTMEQEILALRTECLKKDATMVEVARASKRIADLEDIIKRKNTTITTLKKDLVVLEQKVLQLMRLRRPSFARSESVRLSAMVPNILYDMDSTSPSSSDSDAPVTNCHEDLDIEVPSPPHEIPVLRRTVPPLSKPNSLHDPIAKFPSETRELQKSIDLNLERENVVRRTMEAAKAMRSGTPVKSYRGPRARTPKRRWV
ncbi:uncharacterized protein LOC18431724 isoform X1 [Amborella trichopoda]|uniref:Uncharacterized protein n=1 Tax=Amborella trichopoda TaxID=13333 RepID=W1P9A9_AMBTC|nr:uncharacterized protein LOC18431724 isoform X1 [Amborella trichopoda]ERN03580.1 hypothetical protein AMTR_s00042p00126370 [Amborella trichopoda]|eukprot:XP_020521335.1 uncharacterized protein LOC18431724 isoform X1 [Amborella trichopoda]